MDYLEIRRRYESVAAQMYPDVQVHTLLTFNEAHSSCALFTVPFFRTAATASLSRLTIFLEATSQELCYLH